MKQLTKNFFSLAMSEIARKVLGFLSVAYLTRKLLVADFGLVSLGFVILSYSINFSTAGLNLYGIKEIAQKTDRTFTRRLLSLRLVLSAVVFVLASFLIALLVRDRHAVQLMIVFNCALFAHALLLEWYFQGKEAMHTVSIGKCVTAAVYLILLLVLVKTDRDILWVAIAAVAGDFTMMVFYAIRYLREDSLLRPATNTVAWKQMLRQSLPLGLGTILGQFSTNLAPLVLAVLMSNVEVGLYSAASKLVIFLLLFDRVLGILLLPAAARVQATSPGQLSPRLGDALKWILITALPICVGGMLLSNDIVRMVFGVNFMEAAGLFRILIWYLCFTMIHTVFTSGLVAVAPSRLYGRVMTAGAIVYFLSISALTKVFGLYGAVFGVVFSEGMTLLIARSTLRPYLQIRTDVSILWLFSAIVVMTIVVMALQPYHAIVRILAGAAAYSSILLLLRVVTVNDVAALVWRKTA